MENSIEETLAASREACQDALKRMLAIEGVNVHAGVTITVDVTIYSHSPVGEEGYPTREQIYQIEMELIDAHPGVRFKFEVR